MDTVETLKPQVLSASACSQSTEHDSKNRRRYVLRVRRSEHDR